MESGIFTVSLDLELHWGVRDKLPIEKYKRNLQGVEKAVTDMLYVFCKYEIHVTWAVVGFLLFNSADHLKRNYPAILPKYSKEELSPYKYIEQSSSIDARYHFAPKLIDIIQQYNGHEIGTHTFSHYYCLEQGQSILEFSEDLSSAIRFLEKKGISVKSLVFPRNQYNPEYLSALTELGIQCYRGTEASWIYTHTSNVFQRNLKRAIRLVDAYINISGHHTYDFQSCTKAKPFNFPSSRFLRPYSKVMPLDGLRLARIKRAMDHAAINRRIFHLWWHPHNFGINTEQNMEFLGRIISYYGTLKQSHGMKSLNMGELCGLRSGT